MIYLLDANVLITASNTYYPIDRVPEFWEWLVHQGNSNNVKMPLEIVEEVLEGRKNDDLMLDWFKDNKDVFLLQEEIAPALMQEVVDGGYASDLTDDELEQIGRDPFLVAYACSARDRSVVTTECSAPSKTRQNRKLPDVCNHFSIPCIDTFELIRRLDFRTAWRKNI